MVQRFHILTLISVCRRISTECKLSVMFNDFVNFAVVELGSAMHGEHKINFIFPYVIHNL